MSAAFTIEEYEDRIHEYIDMALDGNITFTKEAFAIAHSWYKDACGFIQRLSDTYGVTFEQAAGITAAMSIRQHWKRNMYNAEQFIRWHQYRTDEAPRCLGISLAKCKAIMISGEDAQSIASILNGRKIVAFFWTFVHLVVGMVFTRENMPVVIDSWMAKIFKHYDGRVNVTQYRRMEQAIRNYANTMNTHAWILQAWLWILVRGKGD